MEKLDIAYMLFNWASVLYLFASTMFLVVNNDLTANLTAAFYLSGSFLYAVSDSIRMVHTIDWDRLENICHFIADSTLTIASIFFFPSLDKAIVGNWMFEISGWVNIITNGMRSYQIYR